MSKPQLSTRIQQIANAVSGRRLKADDPAEDPNCDDDEDEDDKKQKKAKPKKADDDTDDSASHKASASEVIRAGQVRRNEVAETKPTGLALKIINAGRRARNEEPLT